MRLDARIGVRVVIHGEEGAPSDAIALVRLGDGAAIDRAGWAAVCALPTEAGGRHEASCRCCAGRSALADTLGKLFTQRARGEVGFFGQVLLSVPGGLVHEAVAILEHDPLIAGRYRVLG